jgi:hypothetical protein
VARNNAKIAEYNSNVSAQQAQIQQMRSDRQAAAQRGQFIADAGASGINVDSGSTNDVLGLINRNKDEAAIDIRRQGEAQSINFNNQSAAYEGQARAAKSAGITSLIGSVLKAGGQAYDAFSSGGSGSGSGGGSGLGPVRRREYPWTLGA